MIIIADVLHALTTRDTDFVKKEISELINEDCPLEHLTIEHPLNSINGTSGETGALIDKFQDTLLEVNLTYNSNITTEVDVIDDFFEEAEFEDGTNTRLRSLSVTLLTFEKGDSGGSSDGDQELQSKIENWCAGGAEQVDVCISRRYINVKTDEFHHHSLGGTQPPLVRFSEKLMQTCFNSTLEWLPD